LRVRCLALAAAGSNSTHSESPWRARAQPAFHGATAARLPAIALLDCWIAITATDVPKISAYEQIVQSEASLGYDRLAREREIRKISFGDNQGLSLEVMSKKKSPKASPASSPSTKK
jgi:hypothetical protein